jgi:thiol:disulfide interchange protein DsbD
MIRRIQLLSLAILLLLPISTVQAARVSADVSAVLNVSALKPGEPAMIAVVISVHPGLHVQSHQPLDPNLIAFELTADDNPQIDFGPPIYPPAQLEEYAALGRLSVYTDKVIVYLPLTLKAGSAAGLVTISGQLTLQACNETSCFPPEHPRFSVTTAIASPGEAVTPINTESFASIPTTQPASTQPPAPPTPAMTITTGQTTVSLLGYSVDLSREGGLVAGLVAFLAGIIFNLVPCVLPVLPVKAIGFYEASQHSRARSLLLGLTFSLGLIAVFAALGMAVMLSKSLFHSQITWGQQFSNPWFAWALAIVLAALGFGMMGAFSVRLPTSVYGLDFRHDTLIGNFLWGGLTAVLSTPCTAPLFPPVLIFASTLPRIEGFLLVTLVGCGMASPYLLLSAFPELARRFPRTGAAADLVKQMMGFLLLGSAAFFIGQQLVGEPNQWWVVFAVAVWACLYLVIRSAQLFKSVTALYFTTALAVAIGSGSLMLTLRLTAPDQVHWQPYTPQSLTDARAAGKTVLIDFTANWCLNCKYVDTTVYHDPRALDALQRLNVVTMKADLSKSDAVGWQLRNSLGNDGIPYTAIYLPNARQPVGLASIYTTDTLLNVLNGEAIAASAEK